MERLVVAGATAGGAVFGFSMPKDTHSLTPIFHHVISPNSTTEWVLSHPQHPIIFVVDNNPAGLGRVVAFQIIMVGDAWSIAEIGSVGSGGRGPCFMDFDDSDRPQWLLVANYNDGTAASIPVHSDGGLGAVSSITDSPRGAAAFPTPSFQDQSYAHCVRIDPYTRRYALLIDAGLNQLRHYTFDRLSGRFGAIGHTNTSVWRPRHFVWHPRTPAIFVVHELASLVSCYAFDTSTGRVKETPILQVPTTLPHFFSGYNLPAEITLAADATKLLVTNRGAESLAVYDVGATEGPRNGDAWLTPMSFARAGGASPRHLEMLSGDVALVSNERTSSIAAFRLVGSNLQLLSNTTNVSHVACIATLAMPARANGRAPRTTSKLAAGATLRGGRTARPPCSGQSSHLRAADCEAWRAFAESAAYRDWLPTKCHSASAPGGWRDDPCSCTFRSPLYGDSQIGCERVEGRLEGEHAITSIKINGQQMPAGGGIPRALLNLTALTELSLAGNGLHGTIPSLEHLTLLRRLGLGANRLSGSIPSSLARLTVLDRLGLDSNGFTGAVPSELGQLSRLKLLTVDSNPQIRGRLPALPFAQYSECCRAFNVSFGCPLPSDAGHLCVGGTLCGAQPAPTCTQ